VFDYATFEPSMSHVYSFFAVALVLRLTLWVWDRPALVGALSLGAALGLVGLIRVTNLTLVVFCLLVGVERLDDLGRRSRALVRRPGLVAAGVGAFLLTLMPQVAYWHRITGAWITNPYRGAGEHLDMLDPHLIGVLFSVRKGLFFWTPLLVLAVVGLPFLRRTARPVFLASMAYLAAAVWVVASWSIWWYGVSFGMRALIDEMPVFALGLAALVEVARGAIAGPVLGVALGVTTLLAIHGMLAYWLYLIPGDLTTFHRYLESLEYPAGSGPIPYSHSSPGFVDLVPSIVGTRTSAPPGGDVDFTVYVDNPTRSTLSDVLVTLDLSPGLKLLGPPFYERGSGCVGTSTLVCHLDFLEARMSTLLRLGVQVTSSPGSKEGIRASATSNGLRSRHSAAFEIAVAN
jgi:hypothetical protein